MRIFRLILTLIALAGAAPALADNLTINKTATVISDPMGGTRSIPGAVVDYKLVFTNPLTNAFKPVRNMVMDDVLPTNVIMRVSDILVTPANKGPVEFVDGGILGLLGSGLTYSYTANDIDTDGLDFFDGTNWGYHPVADANGYDAQVRAIRIKLTTTFSTGGSFQLRYRVKIR